MFSPLSFYSSFFKDEDRLSFKLTEDINFTLDNVYDFLIEVEDLPDLTLTFTQMTDFVFDTFSHYKHEPSSYRYKRCS